MSEKMAQVTHLPKGSRVPKEPRTVVLHVQSRGGGSISSANTDGQTVLKVVKIDADNLIESFSKVEEIDTIYVIGYEQAKYHAMNLDHLREYASKLTDK